MKKSKLEDAVQEEMGTEWEVFNTNFGFPDLFCIHRSGRVKFIEVKREKELIRKNQSEIFDKLRKLGFELDIRRTNAMTIKVEDETWKVLFKMKVDNDLESLDAVIQSLIKGMEKAIARGKN